MVSSVRRSLPPDPFPCQEMTPILHTGTIEFSDGVYRGDIIRTKAGSCRNGEGIMYYRNGSVHQGHWADNCPHGLGSMTVRSEKGTTVWEGTWKEGLLEGMVTVTLPDGSKRIEQWHDGARGSDGSSQEDP